jgi:hypothetical protein
MATDFLKERSIKYLNRDFIRIKRDLIDFSQAHHSGAFQDFNESSPGMALLDLQAYVGDVLSFYQDIQFMELQREQARQVKNVVNFAKQQGYRPQGKRAARGTQAFFIQVPATNRSGQIVPDDLYAPVLQKGAQVQGPDGVIFETLDEVPFSASTLDSPRFVTGSQFDSNTGLPTFFAIMKEVATIAGETKTDTVTIDSFQPFYTLELANPDVIEVISVEDSDGNTWYEVDYLAQDMVFDSIINTDSTSNDVVPYVLKYISVPRRFITDRDPVTNKTSLIFGSGDGVTFDDQLIPNLADLALPLAGRDTFTTFSLDPQNFLKTRSLGLSPFNTTLTITYRVGGGPQTNVAPSSIKSVAKANLDFSTNSLDPLKVSAVRGSIETVNRTSTSGGGPEETVPEIKANSAAFFAAQNRVVTKEDFIARILTLPAKFGKPEKVFVKKNNVSSLAIDVHVLALDPNGHLTVATQALKDNIKTYLSPFRMLTDGVNILDSNIINLRCYFGIVAGARVNRTEVMAKCLDVVRDYLDLTKMQIGQPIVVSDLAADIQKVNGVVSIYDLRFTNVMGTQDGLDYSTFRFDPSANLKNQILYCPQNSIFEIKYPTKDIIGVVK